MPYGFDENMSKVDLEAWQKKTRSIKNKTIQETLSASKWSNKIYSFESTYPHSEYDMEIELDGDKATTEQAEAWGSAKLAGSSTANQIKALGDVPTVAIPVILKVVQK